MGERIHIIEKKNIIIIYCLFTENSIEKRFVFYLMNLKMQRIDNIEMDNCYLRDIERLVVLVLYEKKRISISMIIVVLLLGFEGYTIDITSQYKKNGMWLISGGFCVRCSPIKYWRITFYCIPKKLNNEAFFPKETQFFWQKEVFQLLMEIFINNNDTISYILLHEKFEKLNIK